MKEKRINIIVEGRMNSGEMSRVNGGLDIVGIPCSTNRNFEPKDPCSEAEGGLIEFPIEICNDSHIIDRPIRPCLEYNICWIYMPISYM